MGRSGQTGGKLRQIGADLGKRKIERRLKKRKKQNESDFEDYLSRLRGPKMMSIGTGLSYINLYKNEHLAKSILQDCCALNLIDPYVNAGWQTPRRQSSHVKGEMPFVLIRLGPLK